MSTICLFWEAKHNLESVGVVSFWLKSQHRSLRSRMHRFQELTLYLLCPVWEKKTCCPEPAGCWQSVVKAAGVHIPRGLKHLVLAGASVCEVTSGLPDLRYPLLFCLLDIVLLCIEDLLEVTHMLLPPSPCYPLFFSYLCMANSSSHPFHLTASGSCLCTFNSAKQAEEIQHMCKVWSIFMNVIKKRNSNCVTPDVYSCVSKSLLSFKAL